MRRCFRAVTCSMWVIRRDTWTRTTPARAATTSRTHCDEETDAQVNQALQDEDQDARYEIYREVGQKLQSEAVNVFLVYESGVVGAAAGVEN